MANNIPKFVQVLKREDPGELLDGLIAVYERGGSSLEESHLHKNPNAQRKMAFVSSDLLIKQATQGQIKPGQQVSEISGYWVYCGTGWYVRKHEDKYQFSRYKAYDTLNQQIVGLWDQTHYDSLNKK